MVFEKFDSIFGQISSVASRWCQFQHALGLDEFLHLVGAFIVKHMLSDINSCLLELLQQS